MSDDFADAMSKALRRAYSLGQTYWQQADSESYSQNRKADDTSRKFAALVDETIALARSGQAASGSSQGARSDERTGWPPGLLQDDSRELSRALASKPDAMVHARDAVAKIGQPEAPTAAPLGWKLVPTDPSNAMLLPIVRAFKCGHAEAWKVLSEAIAAHPPARSGADFSTSDPCPSCRGVGSIGEPPIQCPFCRLHKLGQEAARSGAGSEG